MSIQGPSLGTALPRSGALLYEQVTLFQVTVPMDGSAEKGAGAVGEGRIGGTGGWMVLSPCQTKVTHKND
jgi:hypothetical protein